MSQPATTHEVDLSHIWNQQDVLGCIASKLSSNDRAGLRFVNKAAAAQFKQHVDLHLSQPVVAWAFSQHWAQPGACYNLNLDQREQLASSAAAYSAVETLQVALAAAELPPDERHMKFGPGRSSSYGDSSEWSREPDRLRYGVSWRKLFLLGAQHGSRAICEWCLEQCPDVPKWSVILKDQSGYEALEARYNLVHSSYACVAAACKAARSGHVDLLGWLLREASRLAEAEAAAEAVGQAWGREEAREHLVPSALVGCDLPKVLELWAWCGLDTPEAIPSKWAAKGWQPVLEAALRSPRDWRHKAEWVVERAAEMSQELSLGNGQGLFGAALAPFPGHTAEDCEERTAWLKGQGCRPHEDALHPALLLDRVPALRRLTAGGISLGDFMSSPWWLRRVTHEVAKAGCLALLQELRAKAAAWGPEQWGAVVDGAASGGRMSVLDWVAGCLTAEELRRVSKAEDAFRSAARSGSVVAMTWAIEWGCVADEDAWKAAVESGCEAAVDFLATLGCPQPMMGEPYEAALEQGEWRLLFALNWAGVPLGHNRNRLYAFALNRSAPPEVLKWLEARTGADPKAGAAAFQALRHYCCEWCESQNDRHASGEDMWEQVEVEEEGCDTDAEEEVERARRRHERGRWFGPAGLRKGGRGQARAHRR